MRLMSLYFGIQCCLFAKGRCSDACINDEYSTHKLSQHHTFSEALGTGYSLEHLPLLTRLHLGHLTTGLYMGTFLKKTCLLLPSLGQFGQLNWRRSIFVLFACLTVLLLCASSKSAVRDGNWSSKCMSLIASLKSEMALSTLML